MWTTIGAPHKLHNATIVNTNSNRKRNMWVKVGRQADAEHLPLSKKRKATTGLVQSGAAMLGRANALPNMNMGGRLVHGSSPLARGANEVRSEEASVLEATPSTIFTATSTSSAAATSPVPTVSMPSPDHRAASGSVDVEMRDAKPAIHTATEMDTKDTMAAEIIVKAEAEVKIKTTSPPHTPPPSASTDLDAANTLLALRST